MNILGVDYGLKHVGLSWSSGSLAEPLDTITPDKFFAQIQPLINQYQIQLLVVGLPDGKLKPVVSQIISDLRQKLSPLGIDVVAQDETLSSHDAISSLFHVSPKKRQSKEHSVAATLILQSWLDSHSDSL